MRARIWLAGAVRVAARGGVGAAGVMWQVAACVVMSGCVLGERFDGSAAAERAGDVWPTTTPVVKGDVSQAWRDRDNWPKRWSVVRDGVEQRGFVERLSGAVVSAYSGAEGTRQIEAEMSSDSFKLMVWQRVMAEERTVTIQSESRGAYVFLPAPPSTEPRRGGPNPRAPRMYLKFISGAPMSGRLAPRSGDDLVMLQRTWFAYYDPVPAEAREGEGAAAVEGGGALGGRGAGQARGLAVVVPGMFGTPHGNVEQVVSSLRARGFGVLRMLAHPSRFTEEARFSFGDGSRIEQQAGRIAWVLGDRAAECAYAVEGAVAYLEGEVAGLRGKPRLAVGLSGGAMAMPTIVAWNPGAYQGAVLVAGGADFLQIALRSSYRDVVNSLGFTWSPGQGRAEQIAALVAAYRRQAPLDGLYTAAALRGKPVLVVHASDDRAVPADLGEELWEALGRPERWTLDTGHEFLFLNLSLRFGRIERWIDRSFPAGGGKDE